MTFSGLLRYVFVVSGPVATAASQFLLSFILLHSLPSEVFGVFAFLMVTAQLGLGVWGALFCAPLPILVSEANGKVSTFLSTNLVIGLLAGAVIFALAVALSLSLLNALIFAIFTSANLLRSLARAYAYTQRKHVSSIVSDWAYSGFMLIGMCLFWWFPIEDLTAPFLLMTGGATIGILAFGPNYLSKQFVTIRLSDLRDYVVVWKLYSRWSLVGVITTEATANAHAYIVSLALGPAAFAPVAASALLIRPLAVAINALTDFERPRLARLMNGRDATSSLPSLNTFYWMLVGLWAATASLGFSIMLVAPRLIFPEQYRIEDIVVGGVLWMVVALVRIARTPASVMLQAAGVFRELATASIISCAFSVISVTFLIWMLGPIWSIVGILTGEAVFAVVCIWQKKKWAESQTTPIQSGRSRDQTLMASTC
jgi:O-antigen/teichoic acid export membrane protein